MAIWFVHRRDGSIASAHQEMQPDYAEEALDDQTSIELQAYFQGSRPDLSDADALEKVLKAILLAAGQMAGKTVPQTKAAFKNAWQALP